MALIEDQRIIVWCNKLGDPKACLIDAVYLALKLEKELCLFANYQTEKQKIHYQSLIKVYEDTIKNDLPQLDVSRLVLKGKMKDLIRELGEKYNVILLCCNYKLSNKVLRLLYRSSFPFYFSKKEDVNTIKFKKILIPVDFRNNTKDATLWGSYLGRFNQSEIILHTANDKNDMELQDKVYNTIAFVKKFYGQFFFNFWFQQSAKGSWKIHEDAAQLSDNFDLMIFTGSLNVSLFNWLIGPFEKRVVKHANSSVLVINPQQEMYLLCN